MTDADVHGSQPRIAKKALPSKKAKKAKNKRSSSGSGAGRQRQNRPYPASTFKDALPLGDAIMRLASGDKVRRLTLLQQMDKSPNSSTTKMLITNSGKYGITKGSYAAEFLELTASGKQAVDPQSAPRSRRQAEFTLAIDSIAPFKALYETYKGKRLAEREIMKDVLREADLADVDLDECVDTFTVNIKDLDLLRTIGGAETVVSIEQVVDELPNTGAPILPPGASPPAGKPSSGPTPVVVAESSADFNSICFYITPIGADDSENRKHADLFMSALIQPALQELGLTVVRADQIGEPGMITSQILEYLKRSKLAVADMSYLNPNVFYEVALRHAQRLPVVQIIRKADKLPFDVNQTRTITIDTTDIYSLVPKIQTYRSEIANQARKAIEDPESVGNPITIFYPAFFK